ncbi:mitogen-activated protein kinase kinase kinase kinase 4-like isoform X2 [Metopolophium dirhodum]|uniref:mitogen-activated protein kinase kinase kinase kinase 4-like isoform X2 n=1 Tax=Metopolophium dirhodum TaxID=44670 RepID=UPI00298F40C8|nr:mitogen-activated protein kinase kinase kinase kinase 4-like isoform X2 [Metopolophium dirhodum]
MECNVREISNAVMIESLDTIIRQESRKLEMDKNTGLLAKKSNVIKVQQQLMKENENIIEQNLPVFKALKNHSSKQNKSCDRVNEIERLANLFTQSPSFFTKDNSNHCIDVKHNQVLLENKMPIKAHNEVNKYKAKPINRENTKDLTYAGIKVRRNVRFGEYSPLNPANQVDSQPFLGIGEYDDKKKKLLELQRKEYVEYLSKVKQDKNTSNLPKLAGYSCEEAFKTAMENNNSSDQVESKEVFNQKATIQRSTFIDGAESCASDEERKKETNRLKQELYRFDLSKQIEEKRRLELEQKRKDQLEDEAIERMAREQEEKMKMEFEKENEKRTLAQLQKQLQQEKLKNEIMQKQKDLETKSWNMPSETVSRQLSKHTTSHHESFEDNDTEEFHCPPQSTFDNVPLPTTRVRAPRKIVYDEDDTSVNRKTLRDVSCNTDAFKNPCMNQNISPPVMSKKMERAHVTFASDPPMNRTEYNSAALLPVTKSVIIDSPLTLALAGLRDSEEDDRTCEAIEPTETAYRNQVDSQWYYHRKY